MTNTEKFIEEVKKGYTFKGECIELGGAMYEGECVDNTIIKIPLNTLNRHGLITGATGTGKTKTLQILAEQMSEKGIPVLLMDVKGDLSGIAVPSAGHPKIDERHEKIGIPFTAGSSPVEFLTISAEKGVRMRATVSEFGPVLFSKILDLNDLQQGIVAVVFKYCDDHRLPLVDLNDFRGALNYLTYEGKKEIEGLYGRINTSSSGAIMRKLIELEQQKADLFFGEPSFEVEDLARLDANGKGMVSILRVTDIQDRPKLFSTFMLQILAEIYASFPEEGDMDKPKLVMFIDEAHLVFDNATNALMDQIEAIIKLIRSKGVGIFFVTQDPADVPEDVLGQLGMKVQHALRAFTAKDRKNIKLVAQNFPISEYYDIETILTSLGIGEALVTALNEKGIPSPLVHTMLRAPKSRMDVLTKKEMDNLLELSYLIYKYNKEVDPKSAKELLEEKLKQIEAEEHQEEMLKQQENARNTYSRKRKKTVFEELFDKTTTRQIGRTVARELTRSILGVLGVGYTRKRRK